MLPADTIGEMQAVRVWGTARLSIVWRALKRTFTVRRTATLLATVFSIGGFALLLATMGLEYHYAESRPKQSSRAIGRIYPLNVHGSIVYLTKDEQDRLSATWIGFVVCGSSAVCLHLLSRGETRS
jgi:hypothetical protein